MSGPDPSGFLADPLSDVSRRERRNLLIASTVGVLIAQVGLVPTHISALGIDFPAPAQSSFLLLVAAVVGYFVIAFLIYAFADFILWRKKRHDYLVAVEIELDSMTPDDVEMQRLNVPSISWYYRWSPAAAYARVFFEFVIPLLVGLYALGALLFRAAHP